MDSHITDPIYNPFIGKNMRVLPNLTTNPSYKTMSAKDWFSSAGLAISFGDISTLQIDGAIDDDTGDLIRKIIKTGKIKYLKLTSGTYNDLAGLYVENVDGDINIKYKFATRNTHFYQGALHYKVPSAFNLDILKNDVPAIFFQGNVITGKTIYKIQYSDVNEYYVTTCVSPELYPSYRLFNLVTKLQERVESLQLEISRIRGDRQPIPFTPDDLIATDRNLRRVRDIRMPNEWWRYVTPK